MQATGGAARPLYSKRGKTVALDRIPKRRLRIYDEPIDEKLFADRPKTRSDCKEGVRPCPYVSCKHHLYLDVTFRGSLTYNFPNQEVDELKETCSLDLADAGGVTLQDVGEVMNITRERVRQIEHTVLAKLRRHPAALSVIAAGGFEEKGHSPLASAQEDNDVLGGGQSIEPPPKTPEEEADEAFSEKVDRIYERRIRERDPR